MANILLYGWAQQLMLLLKCPKLQNAAMLAAIDINVVIICQILAKYWFSKTIHLFPPIAIIKLGNASLILVFQQ